ncbi:hypothetical protein MOMA_03660 [Moraxella macacae 0408225]|uniref:DUF305 domain-containing protein n=1 Tax=Moraxella macacae 0408225 TaxID=1230338 RepID=L2FAH3_9GAMM|nr:DUF305 domain-containing protein [Moraxella macacae]ELA09468.1 hypothetical protein MOMA_03660 [Moraxella macacae 0408225]
MLNFLLLRCDSLAKLSKLGYGFFWVICMLLVACQPQQKADDLAVKPEPYSSSETATINQSPEKTANVTDDTAFNDANDTNAKGAPANDTDAKDINAKDSNTKDSNEKTANDKTDNKLDKNTLSIEEFRVIYPSDHLTNNQSTNNKLKSNPSLDNLLLQHTINQFLPNGEISEDFRQAYLASIYTMRFAKYQSMDNPKSPDVVFVQNMIRHHQGGIDMAKIELKYGKDASLKRLAKDMIATQQNEIWLMQHWLKEENYYAHSQPNSHQKTANIQQIFTNSIDQMHEQMLAGAVSDDADMAFIQTMLPHHKGTLAMAQVQLKYGSDPKMHRLADTLIMNQIAEIQAMEHWLTQNR